MTRAAPAPTGPAAPRAGTGAAPRVGIVGARRARQGLGPYVARDLVAAGAQVPCFLATTAATRDAALAQLRETAGIAPRGHLDLAAMLDEEPLDALAILSPPEHHAAALEAAAGARLHVLCEKPFVWGAADPATHTREILRRFAAHRLLVWENCQWPWTLPGFAALHPGALDAPPRRFEMELEPLTRGLQSLADALPHPLSLLQALVPGDAPRLEDLAFSTRDPSAPALSIRFRYRTALAACDATVHLRQRPAPPRRAAYAIDGRRAQRVVSPSDYRLSFADSDRVVPIADPLTRLVADFVDALSRAEPGASAAPARSIETRMRLLAEIATAFTADAPEAPESSEEVR